MTTAGRRPNPTALKVLAGTQRKDRVNPDEPKPQLIELGDKPPTWLSGDRAKRAWKDLAPLLRQNGLLTVIDAPAFGLLVEAFADYIAAREVLDGVRCGLCGKSMRSRGPCTAPAEPPTMRLTDRLVGPASRRHMAGSRYYSTRTESGSLMVRPHPAMAEKDAAWRRFTRLLTEFGSTPAARARVHATPAGGGEVDPAEEFASGLG
jgi:P27 family predicted phage terminase small subunit